MALTSILWRDGVEVAHDFPLSELDQHLATEGELVWFDLSGADRSMIEQLASEIGLDPLAVEDAVSRGERPKVTRHQHHIFVMVTGARLETEAEGFESRVVPEPVAAFVLPRCLVTVRHTNEFDMGPVVERWRDHADLLQFGPSALLYGLLDAVVDGHFETVGSLDDSLEVLEDALFENSSARAGVQRRSFQLRKELVQFRRVVLPLREVVSELRRPAENGNSRTPLASYYDDLYDHVLRVTEWTESLRDMLATIFETNLSLQDAALNTVMKKLAGWAAVIAVPTAVTGWFGQNIPYPGFAHVGGLWQSVVAILVGTLGLYFFFKARDWI
ncbi:MAG TPA: magnesium transporter CorA family protein [Propionibacteriaceae bacterium]|nr:magnesium transporter CorA family protein [Propionibacteriaceae bacterium]